MKKYLLLICFIQISMNLIGQGIWEINFEDSISLKRVMIDTVSNTNNIWPIGSPHKTSFNSANSNPHAIVTDTLDPYPINDTSSFIIVHIASDGWWLGYPKVDIGGWYNVNSDSLTDYGYIDFSPDHGNSWYRADSSEGVCTWDAFEDLPTFTGNSNGWKHFYYCLHAPYQVSLGDTILYRFTFISDSIQTSKDGLMFDDLHFEDWAEGIQDYGSSNFISLFPNPTSFQLEITLQQLSTTSHLKIFNPLCKILLEKKFLSPKISVNVEQLPPGIYFVEVENENERVVKKFVKE